MRISEDRVRLLSKLIMAELDNIEMIDYLVDPNDIRLKIVEIFKKELQLDEDVHKKVIDSLRNSPSKQSLIEGSAEWKAEYDQMYQREMLRIRGFQG